MGASSQPTAKTAATELAVAPVTAEDRAAALAQGAPKVPRRAIAIGLLVAAVLALGGTLLERVFTAEGLNPVAAPTTTTLPARTPTVPLDAGASTLLSIQRLPATVAPPIRLVTPNGTTRTLASLRGDVVAVTFFDASCADQCRALSGELALADRLASSDGVPVAVLTINADPLELAASPTAPALVESPLARRANWTFLTGSLRDLDAVWRAYGVTVEVYPGHVVVHDDPVYVVAPDGRLLVRATPLLDESRSGAYSLPPALARRAGEALARLLESSAAGSP